MFVWPKLLLTFVFCALLTCVDGLAEKMPVKAGSQHLTQTQVKKFKEQSTAIVRNYYDGLNELLGENVDDNEKLNLEESVIKNCFRNSEVKIKNSCKEISDQDELDAQHYLGNIITAAPNLIKRISFDENIAFSGIYYNNKDQFYYVVASLGQTVEEGNKKIQANLDIYLSFDPDNKITPQIFSIQNKGAGVLSNNDLVQIVADGPSSGAAADNKPGFYFDITPANADITIDRKSVFNDGGKIETTPGVHTIKISSPGYETMKFDVAANDNGGKRIGRVLTPKRGYLVVNSADNSLNDFELYIDNDLIGKIPFPKYQLNTGSHYIEIKGGDNYYKAYRVTIIDGSTILLNVQKGADAKWDETNNNENSSAAGDVSFQVFYDKLADYGVWIDDPQYGNVWVPTLVSDDFEPYFTNGHWAATNVGNTWVSADPWGWACYHYGRWTYNEYYKWVWIPGYEWAPAWVTWRFSDNRCGWAPLPPGLSAGVSNKVPVSWWVFVSTSFLYDPAITGYRDPGANNKVYISQTSIRNNVKHDVNSHVYYNLGPTLQEMKQATNLPINLCSFIPSDTMETPLNDNTIVTMYVPNLSNSKGDFASPENVIQGYKQLASPQEIMVNHKKSDFILDRIKLGQNKK